QMSRRLAVKWPRSLTTARAEIEEFLSLTDRHHSVDDRCLEGRLDMPEQVRRAYSALVTIARDGENGEAHAELDQIGSDLDRAAETFGPILADVTRANPARTAEIDELRKSFDQLQTVLLERGADAERTVGELTGARAELTAARSDLTERLAEVLRLTGDVSDLRGTLE